MSKCVVICEKPSQAENIRGALGDRFGEVLPAQGHLYTLADPESYNDEWKNWRGYHLLLPDQFRKVATVGEDPARTAQLERKRGAIAKALKNATRVIIATDCDREGQVIGTEIIEFHGFKGEVLRAMFTSEDALTLQEAFSKLKPNSEYRALYEAGLARERADQVYNLSLTRAATSALVSPGVRSILGVGRVRTPTLAIVCMREVSIGQFRPSTSFGIKATISVAGSHVKLTHHQSDPPVTEREEALKGVEAVLGERSQLVVAKERKQKAGPKPADLSTLQGIAGKWGWSSSKVMEICQSLYDSHKVITYPRAETRYLPDAMIPFAGDVFTVLARLDPWAEKGQGLEPIIRRGKQGVFSDAGLGGESHHAIMPNPKTLEALPRIYVELSDDERRLFDEIARLYLQALSADYRFEETTLTMEIRGDTFSAKGVVPIDQGWRAFRDQSAKEKGEGEELPSIPDGSEGEVIGAEITERTTKPPERFNEGTLILAMKNAAKYTRDPSLRERLKDAKGIGTTATRDTVVRGLHDQGLIMTKAGKLYPTQAGMTLFTILHKIAPSLVDPGTTAEWESKIDDILTGAGSLDAFVAEVGAETKRLIELLRVCEPTTAFGTAAPTDKMVRAAQAISKRKGVPPPPDFRTDFSSCQAFLQAHPST